MARSCVALAAGLAIGLGCSQTDSAGPHRQGGDHSSAGHHAGRFDDAEKWAARFEDPARDEWQRPDYVIGVLSLPPDAKVADIGSATGYFPVRFARALPEGFVYGMDIEPALVEYLNQRARDEGLSNLKSLVCPEDDAGIPEPVDCVFICDTYHHLSDRVAYLRRLTRYLRPGGRVVIVDFHKRDLPVGPRDLAHKLDEGEVRREFQQAGYELLHADEGLPYQYFLIFAPGSR